MTEITPGEIKLIYLQIVMMAIIGIFLFLYSSQPITQSLNINSQVQNTTKIDSTEASWINGLMPIDAGLGGILPNGITEIIIVSSIFLVPLTIMNSFVAIRFIADLVKGIL